jgi:hypothetical protein
VKALVGKAMANFQATNNEISMQLDYIQLQIKTLDQKITKSPFKQRRQQELASMTPGREFQGFGG